MAVRSRSTKNQIEKRIKMSESVKIIESEAEFQQITAGGVVLVDFFADWCRPCKMQLPILEEVAKAFAGRASVVKVDTEKLESLARQHDVSSIPTLVLYKDGRPVDRFVGLQQTDSLKTVMESVMS